MEPTKQPEPDDPLEMHATLVDGDPELMLTCVVEEYAREGFERESILSLFRDPIFLATHGLSRRLGAEHVQRRVDEILSRCGVLRSTTTVPHDPPPEASDV